MHPLLATVLVPMVLATAPAGYHVEKHLPIGGDGGWDCVTYDAGRLYIARGTRVQVVDADKGTLVGEVTGLRGAHAVVLTPDARAAFASSGGDSSVVEFDSRTLAVVRTIKLPARNPDAMLYEPATKRVFAFCAGSDAAVAIDAATGAVAGVVPLGGRPEFGAADGKGMVYVNLEDSSAVAAFDAGTLTVKRRWSLAPGEEPSGIALDREHGVLFSGCHDSMMVMTDVQTGRVIGTAPIGRGVDGVAFDAGRHLAFSSNGDGTLTVVKEDDPQHFHVLANVPTQRGARTLALDEHSHRVYVVTAQFGPPPAPTPEQTHPRATILPGTFEGLVVAP